MRLISWNIKWGGGDRIKKQVEALCARNPDVIALQEIIPQTVDIFRREFKQTKLKHIIDSFPQVGRNRLKKGRQFGELIASRWELEKITSPKFRAPWPEKILSVNVYAPQDIIEINTVHLPNGSNHGWTKIEMFEAIYKRLACNVRHHRILCGDFNSPEEETRRHLADTSSPKNTATNKDGCFQKNAGTWVNEVFWKDCEDMI
jgi:endonuclease/exonuclease/phosphatase family metal-dependent hydrolase